MEFILRGCCDVFGHENVSLKWKYECMLVWKKENLGESCCDEKTCRESAVKL